MSSLWIKERVSANHMDHLPGRPLKDPGLLCIQDFVPTSQEKDYLFSSLVPYYASRLIERHPEVFKSLNSCIKPNKKHQFEEEMSGLSMEFSGDLFTKSESRTEDLITMMSKVQKKYTSKFRDAFGNVDCFEKKVMSGDNKTEKNSHYGILRYFSFLILVY